ncbi:TPA: hypothetical protein DEB00_02805 [Candidatus Uhrbacteria bacterium]|nr:hypothetical protein [Candidatus Uhrbacteria bacterium]
MTIPFITKLTGLSPGPIVTVLGATHGDEPGGALLVEQLLHDLSDQQFSGILYTGIGNPIAYKQGTRSADVPGLTNLNRVFTQTYLDQPSPHLLDVQRAQELAPLLRTTDYLIDLHATSHPSEPFICFGKDPLHHLPLYKHTRVHSILTDPNHFMGSELGTTDAYVDRHSGIGICYETGQWSNQEQCRFAYEDLLNMLRGIGFLSGNATPYKQTQIVYCITHQGRSKTDVFTFNAAVLDNWSPVKQGQVIGVHGDGSPEVSPVQGAIIFQSRSEHVRAGQTIYSLVSTTGNAI